MSLRSAVWQWNSRTQSSAKVPQHGEEGVTKQQRLWDMEEGDGARERMKGQEVSQGCLEPT